MNEEMQPPFEAQPQVSGDDAVFDELLRGAMRARPEPAGSLDLAVRAIRLSRSREAPQILRRIQRLARQRWWGQITGIAAALLIGAMLAGAANRLWTRGDISSMAVYISSSDSDSASPAAPDSSSTPNAAASNSMEIAASVLVGELLLIGMLLASLSRGGAPGIWESDALAGLY